MQESPKVALAFIVDPTDSAQYGQVQFLKDFQATLSGGYLSGGSVGIFRMDDAPKPLFLGPASERERIRAAFKDATKAMVPNSGTDPKTAMEKADVWLSSPQFKGYRKVVVVYSDLKNDARRVNGQVKKFADPFTASWMTKDVELHFYGLESGKSSRVFSAWKNLKIAPRCHQPNTVFVPGDIGLTSSAI